MGWQNSKSYLCCVISTFQRGSKTFLLSERIGFAIHLSIDSPQLGTENEIDRFAFLNAESKTVNQTEDFFAKLSLWKSTKIEQRLVKLRYSSIRRKTCWNQVLKRNQYWSEQKRNFQKTSSKSNQNEANSFFAKQSEIYNFEAKSKKLKIETKRGESVFCKANL